MLFFSCMTSTMILWLLKTRKHSLLSFKRLRIGCTKMVRMRPKECMLLSLKNLKRFVSFIYFAPYILLVCILKKSYDFWSQVGGPIEARYKEWMDRGPSIDQLAYCINSFRDAALSKDPKFDHIEMEEKQKVFNASTTKLAQYLFSIHWLQC